MSNTSLSALRNAIRKNHITQEGPALRALIKTANLSDAKRQTISQRAVELITQIRGASHPGIMEVFLAEYGLSTDEGIALMCLAEALLRVPDAPTMDALIEDKIAASDWGHHLGHSTSSLVNASTWALMLTGKILEDQKPGLVGTLRGAVKRLGEPVIRTAVNRAMREMGQQFVLGETISAARVRAKTLEAQGFTYSYDMLGEAACNEADAKKYHLSYSDAITSLAKSATHDHIHENPEISVKLSALHPRYEMSQRQRVMDELVPRVRSLALLAKSAGIGFNIDAEEADRLDLSLDVIEAVLRDPSLANWSGFGVVVQAYGTRASGVIDWLYALAKKYDRNIMVRLVKGAYWDTEIKQAQTLGLKGFPVFTRKPSTDVSYIACGRKLLGMTDRIYPQFATHNAHTVAAIIEMSDDKSSFEFQRLHGMGEALHDIVVKKEEYRCRVYAPVGAHRDLLAYLVRRLLENGANSSFVNQIVDLDVPPSEVATDPFVDVSSYLDDPSNQITVFPKDLFAPSRKNSKGWDLADPVDLAAIEKARSVFIGQTYDLGPILSGTPSKGPGRPLSNPAVPADILGSLTEATEKDVQTALSAASPWDDTVQNRCDILNRAADLYEQNFGELFALLSREAGKTQLDAVGELREAVDFIRYYANQALQVDGLPRGLIACISPWNFPLAIFTGQLAAALAAGNGVIAKPAEQTSLIALRAAALLHQAGVPISALQILPGQGATIGAALTSSAKIDGICFTGSTPTAQIINRAMAKNLSPDAPFIAETGGLNAMIVDSTALPEQAVRDILASAFQSAGQRCSALRVLYVQADIRDSLLKMLTGAMDELLLGDPWQISTDVGPVIDQAAAAKIANHVARAQKENRLIKQCPIPKSGHFIGPAIIEINGIEDLQEEIFGPVLHVATFEAHQIDKVVRDINAKGFGLTFGLHTRIDDRVQQIVDDIKCGNIYVNRNQIGAVVGSQPFGGEGLSGTGPKAGGPDYLLKFFRPEKIKFPDQTSQMKNTNQVQQELNALQRPNIAALKSTELPGPTGELNLLSHYGKGKVLCLGPGKEAAAKQADQATGFGCTALKVPDGADLRALTGFVAAMYWGGPDTARAYKIALSQKDGPIIPLITSAQETSAFQTERHLCVDTTASGGNAALLGGQ